MNATRTGPGEGGGVPSPRLVAAQLVLGQAATEQAPWWAASWLTQGHDGPALRELAGFNGKDVHAIRDLLLESLTEMGVALPAQTAAAATEIFDQLARMCRSGLAGERWIAQKVEEVVVQSGYATEVIELPLGILYGVEDAWSGGWGPQEHELAAQVRQACADQLAGPGNPGDVAADRS